MARSESASAIRESTVGKVGRQQGYQEKNSLQQRRAKHRENMVVVGKHFAFLLFVV